MTMPPTKKKTTTRKKMADNNLDFEAAMTELDTLVAALEGGDLNLEDSLKQFERGIQLTRQCQSALQDAEKKVEQLLKDQ